MLTLTQTRPTVAAAGGVSDHGLLTGLLDDDHPQYALADKTRPSPWVAAADLAPRSLADLGTRLHSDLTSLAYADAGHTGFCSLGTAQTITAEKLVDSAARLRFGHAAGPTIEGPASGNQLTVTADLQIAAPAGATMACLAIAPSTPTTKTWVNLAANLGTDYGTYRGINLQPQLTGIAPYSAGLNAVYGQAMLTVPSGATGSMQGLQFTGFANGAGTITEMQAVWGRLGSQTYSTVTIDKAATFYARYPLYYGAKPTRCYGLYVEPHGASGITDAVGLLVEAPANATNNYVIWAGAPITGTPRLRLDAGTPGANQTMLYLAEGTTPTVRRVQWKDYSALVAGDRVMVLV